MYKRQILGILAAVIIPNITKFLGVGQKGAAQGELGTIQQGVYAAMAEKGVGAIEGSIVHGAITATQGQINTDPEINLGPTVTDPLGYLQGGLDGLKGSWNVTAPGLVNYGTYPEFLTLSTGATYWEYTLTPTPTWTQRTK